MYAVPVSPAPSGGAAQSSPLTALPQRKGNKPLFWPVPALSQQVMAFAGFIEDYPRSVATLGLAGRIHSNVFLLDEMGRVRWRAVGPAAAQHSDEWHLAKYKSERPADQKPMKAELEVMLKQANALLSSKS